MKGVINPIKLLIISFSVWLFFYIQIPVVYLYEGSAFFPIFTLIIYVLFFIIGFYSFKLNTLTKRKQPTNKKIKQIVFLLVFIGFIGVIFKTYIGIFKNGIFVAEDIFEKRLENMGVELSGGGIGILASMLYPFSFISLLIVIYNYKIFNKYFILFVTIIGLYPLIETFYMGGRTTMVLLGVTTMYVIYASINKNIKIALLKIKFSSINILTIPKFLLKKIVIIPLLLISMIFISYSISIANKRLTRFSYGNHTFEIWERKDYRWVKFDEDFKAKYFKSSKEEKSKMLGLYSLKHYFVHGVIEYIRLVNDLEKNTGYYYGQYEFNVFFKFFKFFGIPLKSYGELGNILKRKAVYQTFWGPFYVDFGIFGFIVMFFWGRFVKKVYAYAKRQETQYVIFYGFLSTIIITSVFLNFLLGSASYYLFAFLITILLFKYWPKNLKIILK